MAWLTQFPHPGSFTVKHRLHSSPEQTLQRPHEPSREVPVQWASSEKADAHGWRPHVRETSLKQSLYKNKDRKKAKNSISLAYFTSTVWSLYCFIWAAKTSFEQMLWDRQEDGFSLGAFLTDTMFAGHSCTPLQKTGEGFAEHHLALAELVPLFELFPVPLFSQTHYILPIISKGTCFEESFTPAQSWTRVNHTWQEKGSKYKETNCATCWFCLSVFSVWCEWWIKVVAVFSALFKTQNEVQHVYTVQMLIERDLQYYRFYGSEPTDSNNPSGRYLHPSIQNPVSALCQCHTIPLGRKGSLYRGHYTQLPVERYFAALWRCPTLLSLTAEKTPMTKLLAELLRFLGTTIEHMHGMESITAGSLPSAKNPNKPL